MTTPACPSCAGCRFPAGIISHAVWLCFRFPLSLRMADELRAARSVAVSHEVVLTIAGVRRWLWHAVDQNGLVLDILVQSRRDARAAKRLLRKLLKRRCRAPRAAITGKLASYGAAKREVMPSVEHRKHKGPNNRAENPHQPARRRGRQMKSSSQPASIEPPGPRPFRPGPRSPASPLRRSHGHAALIALCRNLGSAS